MAPILPAFTGSRACGSLASPSEPTLHSIVDDLWKTSNRVLMASSSQAVYHSSAHYWKYDMFLSFRGPDTRKGITSELYHRLHGRGVKTFMDDRDLQVGDVISPTLLAAIKESRFAIVVLSQNYAFSTWCLEELREICLCMEDNSRIMPLFYHVDPTDVRHQKKSFEVAFIKHVNSERYRSEKLAAWKDALKNVANISGWNTNDHKTHQELIDAIVEYVCLKVIPARIEPMEELEEFQATRQAMDGIMKSLRDDEFFAIGVYGMGGVGKTTVVKHVSAQACNNGTFHHVIMAVVSQNPDFKKLQGTLAEQLGFKMWEESDVGRIGRLYKEIMRREKLLIILDDVWERIDFSKIGIPSFKELQKHKSKVLFTTRRLNVCHTMESQSTIHLSILSEEDAWSLFSKKARKNFQNSIDFYKVARNVASECAGLPVALIAVARALGDKDFEDWKEAARRLKMSQPANLDEENDIFNCIKLSYDYLSSDDAKFCFLLCCLFPEDFDIKIEDLVKYGFGTGLFRDASSTIENARARAKSVTKFLKASCLLLDGTKEGYVKMHDVIRDMAISIAFSVEGHDSLVKTQCHLNDWSLDVQENYSAISLMESSIRNLPNKLVSSKLQILLLQDIRGTYGIPQTFFQSANDIRVLDLMRSQISALPSSLSLLTRLQALRLDGCYKITGISILGELKTLEILSMRDCWHIKFPKEIRNLVNLRMLDFSGTRITGVPSQVIQRLRKLEELYLNKYFGDWGNADDKECGCFSFLNKNADFDELTGLSCLNTLEISVFDVQSLPRSVGFIPNWINFHISISSLMIMDYSGRCSRGLTLTTTMKELPGWFISAVTEKTEALCYKGHVGITNLLEEYERGRLHGLKYLCIDVSSHWKMLLSTTKRTRVSNEPVFENLEELTLLNCTNLEELCSCQLPSETVFENLEEPTPLICTNLEEICGCELPTGSLGNLKILNLHNCASFVKPLLSSKLLQRLSSLEKVACTKLEMIEYIFGFEGNETAHLILTKLRTIVLKGLCNLRNIWNGSAPAGIFQSLKIFSVCHCAKLEYLITSDVALCLSQLEDLWVADCHSLNTIIEAGDEIESNKIVLPKLKNLLLMRLPKLTRFSRTRNSVIHIYMECPSLEYLYLFDCPQFSSSASDFNRSNQIQLNHPQNYRMLHERISQEAGLSQFPV